MSSAVMKQTIPVSTRSNMSNAQSQSLYLTGLTHWYRLPKNEHQSVLVFSISASQAPIWVTAQTVLTTLLFMAACELAVQMVVTLFEVGNSGTRRAILVAYYNAGAPSRTIYLMFGYLRKSLFGCTKALGTGKTWVIDWSAARASFLLLFIAFSLLSGDLIFKFFLGGTKLVESYAAPANPAAIFYPISDIWGPYRKGLVDDKVMDAVLGLRSTAVFQAIARKTSGADNLRSRIAFTEEIIPDGILLPDGTKQNGTGARFTYQYNITGDEMGLRDAPSLVFAVNGTCATYHGPDAVFNHSFRLDGQVWEYDVYPFFGNRSLETGVIAIGGASTPPRAELLIQREGIHREQAELNGGWRFQLVPHTAWRMSRTNISADPWYETGASIDLPYVDNIDNLAVSQINKIVPNRVKRAGSVDGKMVKRFRPPLRCTQNDTYTYNGITVNHVNKLGQLRGLQLSTFIRYVFVQEFGVPVFDILLTYAPFSAMFTATQSVQSGSGIQLQHASLLLDLRELVTLSLVYSREVVRNTVQLSPSLDRENLILLNSAAVNGTVPVEYADFFLVGPEVAALSVIILMTTIAVTVFLWLLVLIWNQTYDVHSKLDNRRIRGRHRIRIHALQAANLYRYLDEALSGGKRKWSGRNSNTPFIRDLDDVRNGRVDSLMPVVSEENTALLQQKAEPVQESNPETSLDCESEFAEPRLVRVNGDLGAEEGNFIDQIWNAIQGRSGPVKYQKHYEVDMTRRWNSGLPKVPWRDIREGR